MPKWSYREGGKGSWKNSFHGGGIEIFWNYAVQLVFIAAYCWK